MKYLLQEAVTRKLIYHIMRLLLLNASQVSLFVRFVNLFVVGTSFIKATFYLFSEFTGVEIGVANEKVVVGCDGRRLNLKSLNPSVIYFFKIIEIH